ncbi:adenylyltransferase and sulfurtransferase MOCS3 [Trifolium repens]|nr:adenylyltransferase and sulfurtransferase MOCS3 [Trifolium repens]
MSLIFLLNAVFFKHIVIAQSWMELSMWLFSLYNHNGGPCYRCLFPTPPHRTACQSCAEGGVLGVVSGIIGCLQALEAIKIAASVGEPLSGRMLLFDALSARIRIVSFLYIHGTRSMVFIASAE